MLESFHNHCLLVHVHFDIADINGAVVCHIIKYIKVVQYQHNVLTQLEQM